MERADSIGFDSIIKWPRRRSNPHSTSFQSHALPAASAGAHYTKASTNEGQRFYGRNDRTVESAAGDLMVPLKSIY